MCRLKVRFSQSSQRRGVFNYALKVEVTDATGIPSKIFVYRQSPAGTDGNTFAEFDHIATPVDFQEIPEDAASETVPWYRTDKCTVWFRNVSDLVLAKQLFVDDINALTRTYNVLTSENGFRRQTSVEFSENGVHEAYSDDEDTIQKEIEAMKKDISGKVSKDAMSGVEVETNTTEGIRNAVQQIGNTLGARIVKTVVLALSVLSIGASALGAGFSGERFADIDLDENPVIVTNITFDGLATLTDITNIIDDISTNFVPVLKKEIADASVAGTNYVDSATNEVMSAVNSKVSTNDFNTATNDLTVAIGSKVSTNDFNTATNNINDTIQTLADTNATLSAAISGLETKVDGKQDALSERQIADIDAVQTKVSVEDLYGVMESYSTNYVVEVVSNVTAWRVTVTNYNPGEGWNLPHSSYPITFAFVSGGESISIAEADAVFEGSLSDFEITLKYNGTPVVSFMNDSGSAPYIDYNVPLITEPHFNGIAGVPNTSPVLTWGGPATYVTNVVGELNYDDFKDDQGRSTIVGEPERYDIVTTNRVVMTTVPAQIGMATNDIAKAVEALRTNKADKISDPVSGNLVAMDASGNITNSGWSISSINGFIRNSIAAAKHSYIYNADHSDRTDDKGALSTIDTNQIVQSSWAINNQVFTFYNYGYVGSSVKRYNYRIGTTANYIEYDPNDGSIYNVYNLNGWQTVFLDKQSAGLDPTAGDELGDIPNATIYNCGTGYLSFSPMEVGFHPAYAHFALETVPDRSIEGDKKYVVGDLVGMSNVAYRCTNAYTSASIPIAPSADATHWTEIPVLAQKADKPATFTTGNLAALDADGNPTDSGIAKTNLSGSSVKLGAGASIGSSGSSDPLSVAIGNGAKVQSSSPNSVAIGNGAESGTQGAGDTSSATAIGNTAKASAKSSVAIGSGAQATATAAVQIGYSATANTEEKSLRFRDTVVVGGDGKIPASSLEASLVGESMPAKPSQDELAEAVKKIFTALGGTVTP